MSMLYQSLWSPFVSNKRTISFLASGAAVVLLTQKYTTTTSESAKTQLQQTPTIGEHRPTNHHDRSGENAEASCDQNDMYQPKYPYPEWDHDWDDFQRRRDSANDSSLEKNDKIPTRHILLIRHGQYEQGPSDDKDRILTELGKRQAKLTGQRLASMMNVPPSMDDTSKGRDTTSFSGPCYITSLHMSTMTRAKETAEIVRDELQCSGHHHVVMTEPDRLLNEGLPAPIIPHRPDVGTLSQQQKEIHENHDRIERAFQKYFHRRLSSTTDGASSLSSSPLVDHEFEVIVCHANVIRYFVMRALQLPPEAWLRLSLFNCSMTYLIVQPNGYVTARLIGDTGHIPYDETTFSGSFGYNWAGPPLVTK